MILSIARFRLGPRAAEGATLAELLVALALIGFSMGVGLPAFSNLRSRASIRAAADVVVVQLRQLRSQAISERRSVGWQLRRSTDGSWLARPIADGDGDGLRSGGVAAGIDPVIGPDRPLLPPLSSCQIGLPDAGVPDPSQPSRIIDSSNDPVRFGASDIISFSPIGAATPGTLFLTEPAGRTVAVRLHGGAARPHLLHIDAGSHRWIENL